MNRLLLRQRLHLNLNLNVTETLQDGVDIDDVDDDDDDDDEDACDEYDVNIGHIAGVCDAQGSGRRRVGDNLQTVTTVPQTKQQQLRHKITTATAATTTTTTAAATTTTTSSSTASSALAKFNRIIESANLETHRASAAFSSATLQQRLALAYPDQQQQQQQHQPDMRKIDNLQRSTSRRGIAVVSTPLTLQALDTIKTKTAAMEQQQLEKQLAHDAAEQTKRNDVHYLLKQLNSFSDIEEIEIVDMKQRNQRQQQRQQQQQPVQQQQQQRTTTTTTKSAAASSLELMPMSTSMLPIPGPISPSTQSHKGNFMAQHSSTGAVDIDPAGSRLQFDDYLFESCHYLETNYFAATYRTAMVESSSHEFRPSTTTPTSTRSDCFELHELEPPSVICKAAAPPMHMLQLDDASPPPYHQAEVRMTSSGVQTELTAESLAQLSHASSNGSSSSSSSTPRVPPFFICCYTPIDRWRARRLGAATAAAAAAAAAASSSSEKNGHAV